MLSVDPGLQGTGWALWDHTGCLIKVGVITPSQTKPLFSRCRWIANKLQEIEFDNKDFLVVCEYPKFFDSAMGQMVARRGDLVKLATLIGVIAGRCKSSSFMPVGVNEWKGTLPKTVVERRIRAIIGEKKCVRLGIKTHAWDAVGIGLYKQGRF